MANESVNYQCPACGGPLHFSSAEQKLACDYCDSRFEVAEVEALYRERQAKADAKASAASAPEQTASPNEAEMLGMNAGYICSSCGAELISDGTVAVSTCPYCGNPAVAPGQLSGSFSPDLVIPFKLERKDALSALQEHYKGKILLPKSFISENHRVTEYSDRTVTTINHYDAYRKGNMSFERVPVDGSTKMPDGHMDAIEPFDYSSLRPFSVAYMPGFIANRYDEDSSICRDRAEKRMEGSLISAFRQTVSSYNTASLMSQNLDYNWEDADYALFPVWMLSTSWNGKNYLFAMNGQTGRMVGELPCSKPKLALATLIFFIVAFVITRFACMGSNAFNPAYFDFDLEGIFINIVIPLVIAAIADLFLVGQLKTAVEATNADSYCGQFDLTDESDTFIRTETRVEMKQQKK